MFIPVLLASSLLAPHQFVTLVKETVWWDTPGGKVIEHREGANASCSLMLYNGFGSVVVEWPGPGQTKVTAVDSAWQFADNSRLPVAMQWGDVWVSNGGGSAIIQAVGHGSMVNFAIKPRIEDILHPVDHIEVRTRSARLSIKLTNAKIQTLLSRFRQCRDAIRHISG